MSTKEQIVIYPSIVERRRIFEAKRRRSSTTSISKSASRKADKEKDGKGRTPIKNETKQQEQPQPVIAEAAAIVLNEGTFKVEVDNDKEEILHDDAIQCHNCGVCIHISGKSYSPDALNNANGGSIPVPELLSPIAETTLESANESLINNADIAIRLSEAEEELIRANREVDKYKRIAEEISAGLNNVSSELENVKQELQLKNKEWEKAETDFMLCMRSAERFTREAEARACIAEAENAILKNEITTLRDAANQTNALQVLNKNGSCVNQRLGISGKVTSSKIIDISATKLKTCDTACVTSQSPTTKQSSLECKKVSGDAVSRNTKLERLRMTSGGGSLRNGLLEFCRQQTKDYEVEINNFSTSWRDGKAFAALMHSLEPSAFDYNEVKTTSALNLYEIAINSAKKLGVKVELDMIDILSTEAPPWGKVLQFVTEVFCAVSP